jgi:HEPN superfamily Apea-like protein
VVQFRFGVDGEESNSWLLYQPIRPIRGNLDRTAVMFGLTHVKDQFEAILDKWFAADATSNEAIGLYLDARFAHKLSLYTQFLMLAQSVEAFSRATSSNEYMTEKEYAPIMKALIGAIPSSVAPDHCDALKSRIKFGNEFSLRKRIELLFDSLKSETADLVCLDRGAFITRLVKMRNYLLHRTDELRGSAIEGLDLYYTCEQLMVLIRILILKNIGIDEVLVADRIKEGHRTSQVIHNRR